MDDDMVDDDDVEIITLKTGENAPASVVIDDGKMTIDKSEFDRLRQQADILTQQKQVLDTLNNQQQQRQPVNHPLPANYKTDAEFNEEIEQEIVASGKTRSAISKVINREVAPVLQHYEAIIADLRKEIVSKDPVVGGVMQKYGKEVDALLATLPANQRATKEAYQFATAQVQAAHIEDIKADAIAEARKQWETEQGGQQQVKRKPSSDAGRMTQPSGSGQKQTIYINDQIKRDAAKAHMDVQTYARLLARSRA